MGKYKKIQKRFHKKYKKFFVDGTLCPKIFWSVGTVYRVVSAPFTSIGRKLCCIKTMLQTKTKFDFICNSMHTRAKQKCVNIFFYNL